MFWNKQFARQGTYHSAAHVRAHNDLLDTTPWEVWDQQCRRVTIARDDQHKGKVMTFWQHCVDERPGYMPTKDEVITGVRQSGDMHDSGKHSRFFFLF